MVGPAFTLRYIPAREDRNQLTEFRNPAHPQRVAVETCPPGHVLVMDSRKDAARRLRRRYPGHPADGARRRRRGHRRRLPRRGGASARSTSRPITRVPLRPTNLTLHEAIDINMPDRLRRCRRSFPATSWSATATASSSSRAHLPPRSPTNAVEMTAYEDFVRRTGQGRAPDHRPLPGDGRGEPNEIRRVAREDRTLT